ncbi:MAG: hypothetical protein AAFW00_20260 [Bacteroidota bacterium]
MVNSPQTENNLIAFAPYVAAYIFTDDTEIPQLMVEIFVYLPDGYAASASTMGLPSGVNNDYTQEITIVSAGVAGGFFTIQRTLPIPADTVSQELRITVNKDEQISHATLPLNPYASPDIGPSENQGYSPNGLAYDHTYGYLTKRSEGQISTVYAHYLLVSANPFIASVDLRGSNGPFCKLQITMQDKGGIPSNELIGERSLGDIMEYEAAEIFTDDFRDIITDQKTTRGPVILSYQNIDEDFSLA